MRRIALALLALVSVSVLPAQPASRNGANGKLQLHFLDVGQGDSMVLVSPLGEAVMFDTGGGHPCDTVVSDVKELGVSEIETLIVSHYHADHMRCVGDVLSELGGSNALVYDRGGPRDEGDKYLKAVGSKRRTAVPGATKWVLDQGSEPVTIDIVASNGNGTAGASDENDLSIVAVIRYGGFVAVAGGDLSGMTAKSYHDIESSVAPKVGQVDVFKVHHHCAAYSSNDTWLSTTTPTVGIVSVGSGPPNSTTYHHPTAACLGRLHAHNVDTYWTEYGEGAAPDAGRDTVADGPVTVEVEGGGGSYSVSTSQGVRSYSSKGQESPPDTVFVWSKHSNQYHVSGCPYAAKIKSENREQGKTPPQGKTPHDCCPD